MVNSRAVRRRAHAGVDREGRRLAPRGGARRAGRHVPAARLVAEPPAVLGRADPDHPLPDVRRGGGARRRAAGPAARRRRLPAGRGVAAGAAPTWSNVSVPDVRRRGRRDTDTMDTFVDSSWYFFRYCSPGVRGRAVPARGRRRWMPVDQYTGGVEHAILHLLYCRFFTKVLYDFGLVGFTEPFPRLMNQGQVIYGGASMSKTKGNIVEPMPLGRALGRRLDAPDHAVRRAVRGRHRLEADRGRSEQAARGDTRGWAGSSRSSDDAVARGADAPEPDALRAPDASNDQGRDRGHGAVPVQHGDLEAAGADERDADGAGRRAARARRPRPRWRRCWRRSRRSPPRSCGGRCWGTGRRSTCRRGRRTTRRSPPRTR